MTSFLHYIDVPNERNTDEKVSLLINTVVERCRNESIKGFLIPVSDYLTRASYYTAISQEAIIQLNENLQTLRKDTAFLECHGALVIKSMHALLTKSVYPNYDNSYSEYQIQCAKEHFGAANQQKFKSLLEVMGYSFKKSIIAKYLLLENPKYTFERNLYLSKTLAYRQDNRQFYYIDVREVETTLNFSECWNKICSSSSKPSKLGAQNGFLYYMVSKDGYESSLYSNQCSSVTFNKWLMELAVPKMKPNSVIVMDKHYFIQAVKRTITRYHSKKHMMKWLDEQHIPYHTSMLKAELYDLITKYSGGNCYTNTYLFIQACGHDVLPLPSSVLNFSLASKFIMFLKQKRISNTPVVKSWIMAVPPTISPSILQQAENNIVELEQEIHKMDMEIENILETKFELAEKELLETDCNCNDDNVLSY